MKFLIFVFSIVIGSTAASSQFGILGGLNMAGGELDLEYGDLDLNIGFDREIGFNIGTRYMVDLNNFFSVRTGIQLSQYNLTSEQQIIGAELNVKVKSDYSALRLMIPMTVMFDINQNFKVFGGAGVSINLDDEFDETVEGEGVTRSSNADAESSWLTLQVGGIVMFNERTGLELVFDYGLNDISENFEANVLAVNFIVFAMK